MTDKKRDGGPAFPLTVVMEFDVRTGAPLKNEVYTGMSLRDHFAGQTLAGHFAANIRGFQDMQAVAQHCYLMADAMLAERDKPK
jgi:hypothetical protein